MSYDVALYDSTGAEITAAGYARQSTLSTDWALGYNGVAITFGPAAADWGAIASMTVWDGSAAIARGPVVDILGDPIAVINGNSLTFAIGTITLGSGITNIAF